MRQETTQLFQLGAHRVQLEQILTQFQIHLYEGGNDVDDLARFFQVKRGCCNPFRYILHKRYQSLKKANHVALDSLCFVVLFVYIWLESDMGSKVGLLLRKFANSHPLQALYNNLNGTI